MALDEAERLAASNRGITRWLPLSRARAALVNGPL
jgi:hypothetical protein